MSGVSENQWRQITDLVAARLGLHFAPARRDDLGRGLAAAAAELGFQDLTACVNRLLSAPLKKSQLEVLASHLTIGETYFFRETPLFDLLAKQILPQLIQERRGRERRLRIWSAASCTGEEPYSLAILLHELLPDIDDWRVTITATDINLRFLSKARAGIYREWSFRNAPPDLRERYFDRTADGSYAIRPEIRKLVTFSPLNLVEDVYPSLVNETNAMDLIFCRNVLMYFTPPQITSVVRRLRHALVEGGRLIVSPSETSQAVFHEFATVSCPGVVLYQKSSARAFAVGAESPLSLETVLTRAVRRASEAAGAGPQGAVAQELYDHGRFAEAARTLASVGARAEPQSKDFSLLARSLANEGRLSDALECCERWIDLDKLDAAAHYLRATVLLEQGNGTAARASLRTALFLRPEFVLAHFALGNLARGDGNKAERDKHFGNALRLLRAHDAESLLPESDGLTAGRLAQTIAATVEVEESQ